MTKRVNIAVFHVLKSIVDSKVAVAKPLVKRARVAQEALPGLCSHLRSLQEWERSISHYETPRYEKGEDTPADLERKIETENKHIERGAAAIQDLDFADKFNVTYKLALLEPQLVDLRKRLRDAEAWVEHWNALRNQLVLDDYDEPDDMERDRVYYANEYERAVKNLRELKIKLNDLQNVR